LCWMLSILLTRFVLFLFRRPQLFSLLSILLTRFLGYLFRRRKERWMLNSLSILLTRFGRQHPQPSLTLLFALSILLTRFTEPGRLASRGVWNSFNSLNEIQHHNDNYYWKHCISFNSLNEILGGFFMDRGEERLELSILLTRFFFPF